MFKVILENSLIQRATKDSPITYSLKYADILSFYNTTNTTKVPHPNLFCQSKKLIDTIKEVFAKINPNFMNKKQNNIVSLTPNIF